MVYFASIPKKRRDNLPNQKASSLKKHIRRNDVPSPSLFDKAEPKDFPSIQTPTPPFLLQS